MKLSHILPYSLVALCLAGGIFWRLQDKRAIANDLQKSQAARKGSLPNVVMATAGPKRLVQVLETVGTLESSSIVKLASKVPGRIASLTVREGDAVKQGDVLIRIDPGELQAAVLQQQAAVAEARARLAQAKATQDTTRVAVTSGIEQQRAAVESAAAGLEQAQKTQEAQVAAVKAAVADAEAKLQSAKVAVENAKNDLASANATQENLKARLARAESLLEKGFVATQGVEDARTALKVQQSVVETAQGRVLAAQAARDSALAVVTAAQQQVTVTEKKGVADIEKARALKHQAEAALTLASSSRSQNTAYQENLAALKQSVAVAEALLAQARARLADTEIRSPGAGTVTARALDAGSNVTAGQTIVTVQGLGWLFITASVPVEQSAQVQLGMRAKVTLDALPGEHFSATVAELNPAADPQSRQFTIRLKLENAAGRFRPGMYARVQLETKITDAAVVVPSDTVKTTPKGSTVTLIDSENVAQVRPVELGVVYGDDIQILSGVSAGEKVVLLSYLPVREGQKVGDGKKKEGKEKK